MSTPLASTDALPNIDVVQVDTDGTTGVLPTTTEEALEADALPLAEEDLEGDVVIYATTPSSTGRNWKRPALLLALVSLLVIAISVGVSNRNNANKGSIASVQQQQQAKKQPLPPKGPKKEEAAADGIVEAPKAAPVKPAKPPKKQAEQFITPYPTDEGTTTVSTEVTAPPTVANRPAGSSVIESPTWRV